MIYESGWLDWLEAVEFRSDGYYCLFSDAGFANYKYLQVTTKHMADTQQTPSPSMPSHVKDSYSHNALMSRIRIHMENVFAGNSKGVQLPQLRNGPANWGQNSSRKVKRLHGSYLSDELQDYVLW